MLPFIFYLFYFLVSLLSFTYKMILLFLYQIFPPVTILILFISLTYIEFITQFIMPIPYFLIHSAPFNQPTNHFSVFLYYNFHFFETWKIIQNLILIISNFPTINLIIYYLFKLKFPFTAIVHFSKLISTTSVQSCML